MTKYKVTCPHCNKALFADDQWISTEAKCPNCFQQFTIPKRTSQSSSISSTYNVKIICEHCNSEFEVENTLLGQTLECSVCKHNFVAEQNPTTFTTNQRFPYTNQNSEQNQESFPVGAIIKSALKLLVIAILGIGGYLAYRYFTKITPKSLNGNQLYVMTRKRANRDGAAGVIDIFNHDFIPIANSKKQFLFKDCTFVNLSITSVKEAELYQGVVQMIRNGKQFSRPCCVDRRHSFTVYTFPFQYAKNPKYLIEDGDLLFELATQINKELQGWTYVKGKLYKNTLLLCTIQKGQKKKEILIKAEQIECDDKIGRVWIEFPEAK